MGTKARLSAKEKSDFKEKTGKNVFYDTGGKWSQYTVPAGGSSEYSGTGRRRSSAEYQKKTTSKASSEYQGKASSENSVGERLLMFPGRLMLSLCALAVIAVSIYARSMPNVMALAAQYLVRPWHRFFGKLFDPLPFSAAAVLIAALAVLYILFVLRTFARARRKGAFETVYRLLLTTFALCCTVYAGFCVLWGTYYYTSDFESQSGIYAVNATPERLESVTRYFAALCNTYAPSVARDESGCFAEALDPIFARSAELYDSVEARFPCLAGDGLHAKPFLFSKAMSMVNFTGFFFPFTGEANINVDCPGCLIPSAIGHELAHQRGVAEEDEANFVSVLVCLESGDAVYAYSGSLLAYIHLGNALYETDRDAWETIYNSLSEDVRADLAANNSYWKRYDSFVSDASDSVYEGFLQSYGQSLGLRTYGACVNLLTSYYYDTARNTT